MIIGTAKRNKEGSKPLPTRHFSKRQEVSVAKKFNGCCTKNSGATLFQPGDVELGNIFLVECKTKMTSSESISIKKDWIIKNSNEALFAGKKYSTVAFNFGPDEPNYYIIDEFLFQELFEYLCDKHTKR